MIFMYSLQAQPRFQPMCPHEETPEDGTLGGDGDEYHPDEMDQVAIALDTLQTRLTKILKHAHTEQGLLAIDLVQALSGSLAQVVSWGLVEADTPDDDTQGDPEVAPEGEDVLPQGWSPASDLPQEDDDSDIDDQGDPRKPCSV